MTLPFRLGQVISLKDPNSLKVHEQLGLWHSCALHSFSTLPSFLEKYKFSILKYILIEAFFSPSSGNAPEGCSRLMKKKVSYSYRRHWSLWWLLFLRTSYFMVVNHLPTECLVSYIFIVEGSTAVKEKVYDWNLYLGTSGHLLVMLGLCHEAL